MLKSRPKQLAISLITFVQLASIAILTAPLTQAQANQFNIYIGEHNANQFEITYDGKSDPSDAVTLINREKEKDITLRVSVVDGNTNSAGQIAYKTGDAKQKSLGAWAEIPESVVTLKPEESKDVRFTFKLPTPITPGTYIGGLSVEDISSGSLNNNNAAPSKQSFSAQVKTRYVQRIILSIPGEKISKFDFQKYIFNSKDNSFAVNIANQGNTILSAQGSIDITSASGYKNSIPINADGIIQQDMFNGTFNWTNRPLWGDYTARINLEVSEYDPFVDSLTKLQSITKEIKLSFNNYNEFLPHLYALIGLIVILLIYFIEHAIYISKCIKYIVLEGDTVKSVADKFQMNWKKLVKINKIKAPYELKVGQEILVRPKNNGKNS